MNDLQVFTNPQFGELRSITIDGEPWFVGNDVAGALGYSAGRNAIAAHVDAEDKLTHQISAAGQMRDVTFINESGVYALVFGSKLESAKAFKRWVTSEVLPSIRKTGSYQRPMTAAEQLLAQANVLVELERRVENQDEQIRETRQRVTDAVAVFSAAAAAVDTWQEDTNRKINEIVESCGYSHQAYRGELYKKLEERAGVDITTRQTRLRNRMKLAGATHKERDAVTKLHVIARDKKLRPIFDGILREERAKHICAAWSH